MQSWHNAAVQNWSGQVFNSTAVLAPPVEVTLNKDNIDLAEKAILNAYRQEPGNKHDKVVNACYWGLMHDGIIKFGME